MATAVQIELRVDEQGAVQGLRVFDTNVKASTASVRQLNTELGAAGAKATATGQKGAAALGEMKSRAREAKEGLHLATEELDIHMPRAFRNLAAQSAVVQKIIGAIGPGLMALGGIEVGAMVFSQLIEGAQKLWENYISLNSAEKEYEEQLKKAREEDYWKSDSIETTILRIREATAAAKGYRSAAEQANKLGWGIAMLGPEGLVTGAATLYQAHKAAGESVKKKEAVDKLTPEQVAQQHELNLKQIEYNHRLDEELPKQKKILALLKQRTETEAENRTFGNLRNAALGNPVDFKHGGEKEEGLKVGIAKGQADTELFQLRKEQAQELAHMREQALEAGLRGSALYHAQEAAAIADLKFKEIDSAATRDAVHLKFHNEQMKRLQDETRETEKIERIAAVAGTTGVAKTRAEGANRVADVRDETFSDVDETGHSALAERQRQAARASMNAEILTEEQGFTDRLKQLSDESASHQISGFARIRAEAQKQIDALTLEFQKLYGKDRSNPDYQQHAGQLRQGVGIINDSAGEQTRELSQRNADETAQIEAQARAHALSAEKQQTAAIQAEYEERLRKYTEELKQQEISQDDYNRRVAAAAEERDGQMVEAAKAAREKMAGEFTRFFKDPLGSMKEMGEKAAGEAAAAMVQRMQGRFGGATGTADAHHGLPGLPGINEAWGGLFGKIAGKKNPGLDRAAEIGKTPAMAQTGLISLATAQIHIQNANLNLGATGTAPGPGAGMQMPSTGYSGGGDGFSLSSPGAASSTSEFGVGFGHGGSTSDGGGNFAAGGATSGSSPSLLGSGLADVNKGVGLFKQAKSIFAPDSPAAKFNTSSGTQDLGGDGSSSPFQIADEPMESLNLPSKSISNNGMLGGGGFMANAGGAAGGAMGLFSAYQSNGGLGGAASGAMSGMELGMSLGGPIGAAVGAVGGAILGAIGFGGREKARVYDLKTVRPRIGNDTAAFQQGSMDYLSAYSDLQALDGEAWTTLKKMGGSAYGYYKDTIAGEIKQAEAKLTREEKAGRSQVTASAAQYDIGTDSVPRTGFAVIHERERIFPSNQNERMTRALERGADMESVHRMYQSSMGTRDARQQAARGGDRTMNMNVHAIDSKGVAQFFDKHKHIMRAALNSSYAENSGGADA